MDFIQAEQYIIEQLTKKLPDNLFYHGIHHTLDVRNAVVRLAKSENKQKEDAILLQTAALYHDSGFMVRYENNEEIGAKLAGDTLPHFDYSGDQIQKITSMILATKVHAVPKTDLEKILCDADYDYLGRDDFKRIAFSLYRELKAYGHLHTLTEWDRIQSEFIKNHRFYTQTARKIREPVKQAHLKKINMRLAGKQ